MTSPAPLAPPDAQEPSPSAKLARSLFETGTTAFDPSSTKSPDEKGKARAEFHSIIDSAGTWTLVQALNGLSKPEAVPAWLRSEIMKVLVRLPLRDLGVRATMEFVFSVHPSSTLPETEAKPEKKGAKISPEALAMATQLLTSVPDGISDQTWIDIIAPQLLHLLDGKEGKELDRVAAYVIAFGVLGRKRLGAPGAPGWNAFVAPILHTIKPSLIPKWRDTVAHESDEVIDISRDKVIVAAADLQIALDRLSLLLDATPSASLCRRLVDPIMVQLWAITSWLGAQVPLKDKYCDVAAVILQTFLKISSATEKAEVLINNLLYVGEVENDSVAWKYHLSGVDVLEVVVPRRLEPPPHIQDLEWVEVEQKSACLASTLVESCTDSEISTLFLQLFRKWVTAKSGPAEAVKTKDEDVEMKDPTRGLLELVVLQQLMEKAPQKLISKADQLLELVSEILDADARESQGSEILSVTLSILNHVISAPVFQKSDLKPGVLELIEGSLERISREGETEGVAQTARNLLLLLKYRGELDETGGATPATDKQVEDRNTYRLAIQYITDTESPPPVKSEGLNLISGLIKANSPAVDLPAVLLLLSRLLAESEDFINLRVIKMFVQLANKHPKTVCQEILDHYLDPKEMSDTDTRLRFGEALLQTIERLGETFTGEVAKQVFEVLLSIASRRGYRPKTEKRQEREARKREKENKEAAEAWGGEVPDMSEDVPEEERLNNEILSRIVEGWESKRGSEDIRMRASALSILSSVIETNIADFGPSLVSAGVDLCLFVLAFEPEPEKAILRRAAIFYILGFVRALAKAREERKNLGFGLTDESRGDILRTLRYIMGTDNDGMVQEHARDVIESLENLRIGDLLQQNQNRGPDIRDITGLGERLNIPGSVSAPRPRIEEIE